MTNLVIKDLCAKGAGVKLVGRALAEVVEAGRAVTPLAVEEEQDVAIHVCRRPREPLRQLWERLGPVWG